MNTDKAMLAIETFEAGEWLPESECTVDQFVGDNLETLSDVEIADLAHLAVGGSMKLGFSRVTRVS